MCQEVASGLGVVIEEMAVEMGEAAQAEVRPVLGAALDMRAQGLGRHHEDR